MVVTTSTGVYDSLYLLQMLLLSMDILPEHICAPALLPTYIHTAHSNTFSPFLPYLLTSQVPTSEMEDGQNRGDVTRKQERLNERLNLISSHLFHLEVY